MSTSNCQMTSEQKEQALELDRHACLLSLPQAMVIREALKLLVSHPDAIAVVFGQSPIGTSYLLEEMRRIGETMDKHIRNFPAGE